MNTEFLWQNGSEVSAFTLSPSKDRYAAGFWLGDGVFETLLVESGAIFARRRHLARFRDAVERLAIQTPWSAEELVEALDLCVDRLSGETGQIRITLLSSGDCLISGRKHLIPDGTLRLTSYPHAKSSESTLSGIKTISYGENAHALRYAKSRSCDDVIFFNQRGEVCESALANLLLFDGEQWWTPPLDSGCLPGVTRELLLENFDLGERTFVESDLPEMQALALTSSLRDIQPISIFEGHSYLALNEVDRLRADFQRWRREKIDP